VRFRLVVNGEDARAVCLRKLERLPLSPLHECILKEFQPPMTSGQRRRLRMWHTKVAAELCARTGYHWTGDDVHEFIFLPKFMPKEEIVIAPGETVIRPLRTSDLDNNKAITAEAMQAYEAWCFEHEIEITVTED
jgi:hypothetical protein